MAHRTIRPVWPADLAELLALADLRHRDPATSLRLARPATNDGRAAIVATAWWVVGLAQHELGDLSAAVHAFESAIAVTGSDMRDNVEAKARASLAVSLLGLGDVDGSRAQIAIARWRATGDDRGFVGMLDGLLLQRTGQLVAAQAAYSKALPALRRSRDDASVARLLLNRGTLRAYQGQLTAALRDLTASETSARRLELPLLVAMAAHNTGFALGRQGDVPGALGSFERAEAAYAAHGSPPRLVGVLAADRCEVLLEAGLTAEARAAAVSAVHDLADAGEVAHADEARLLLARALLAAGENEQAASTAATAAEAFRASGRGAWATLADYVAIQADVRATEHQRRPPARLLGRTRHIATALGAAGWPVEAAHVRTFVGRMALAMDRPDEARAELAATAAVRLRSSATLRVQGWHATALVRLADGDRSGAKRALRAGLKVVDRHRATLGASDLRAHAAAKGADLAQLGLALAVEDGRPVEVLRWAEELRAGALWLTPITPPRDARLAEALTELRRTQASLDESILAGRGDAAAQRAVAAAERRVQLGTRAARGSHQRTPGSIDVAALRARLGDRILVEYVVRADQLLAVVVTARGTRLLRLGPHAAVREEKAHLLSALRRAGVAGGRGASAGPTASRSAERAVATGAANLDELLLAPLAIAADAGVVVVPTGLTHGLPWGALPSFHECPVTVAPSAALWMRSDGSRSRRSPLLVAGPDLPAGSSEIDGLSTLWPSATVIDGGDATVATTLAESEGADLVHLAAHGSFRSDSPLFSSLRMADGALTVYDLERVRRPPRVMVLPACNAAQVEVRPGDELLGTAAALLGLGVRSVVAPVVAVADGPTARFSIALHRHLAARAPVASALARAMTDLRQSGDADAALAAASFICIGTDDRRPISAPPRV